MKFTIYLNGIPYTFEYQNGHFRMIQDGNIYPYLTENQAYQFLCSLFWNGEYYSYFVVNLDKRIELVFKFPPCKDYRYGYKEISNIENVAGEFLGMMVEDSNIRECVDGYFVFG